MPCAFHPADDRANGTIAEPCPGYFGGGRCKADVLLLQPMSVLADADLADNNLLMRQEHELGFSHAVRATGSIIGPRTGRAPSPEQERAVRVFAVYF